MMRIAFSTAFVFWAIASSFANHAVAGYILYTDQFVASGVLGSSTFTNALVTFTFATDTSLVQTSGSSGYYVATSPATVDIINFASAAKFTGPTQFAVSYVSGEAYITFQAPLVGASGFSDIFTQADGQFLHYDLKSSFGPITDPIQYTFNRQFATNQGNFSLSFSGTPSGTFQAYYFGVAVVPEPSSIALLGMGCAGGGLWFLRRGRISLTTRVFRLS